MTSATLVRRWSRLQALMRQPNVRAVVANTGWLLTEKVGRALVAALVSAWVARFLGPTRFASIAYALALIVFFTPLAQLGLRSIIVRDLAREPDRSGDIVGTTLLLRTLSGLICFGVAVVFLLVTTGSGQEVLIGALIVAQLVFQSSDAIDFWFQSRLESRFGVRSRMLVTFSVAGLKVVFILAHMPLWTFALAISLEPILIAVALALTFFRHPNVVPLGWSAPLARRLLREGSAFLVAAIAIAIYMRVDQIMIRAMLGPTQLGLYAAAVPLSQAWQMFSTSISSSLEPMVAREAERGEEALQRAARTMFTLVGGLCLLIAIANAVLAPLVVPLLLGPRFQPTIAVLQVYGFTNVFIGLGLTWNIWATVTRKGRLVVVNTVSGSCVALVANFLLIPRFGILGAAIAANMAFATSGLLANLLTCREVFLLQIGVLTKRHGY